MLHHGLLLGWLEEYFVMINQQIEQKSFKPQLVRVYGQLLVLKDQLNAIYSPIVLCILLSLLLSNSMGGYIALLQLMLPQLHSPSYAYLFGSKFYILLLFHLYSYYTICHRVEATIGEINFTLYEYTTERCGNYERDVSPICFINRKYFFYYLPQFQFEMLVLGHSLHGSHIRIAGIPINWNSLFCMLAQTVSYIITLIQLDYVNLL